MRGLIGLAESSMGFDLERQVAVDVSVGMPNRMEDIYGVVAASNGLAATACGVVGAFTRVIEFGHANGFVETVADIAVNRVAPLGGMVITGALTIEALAKKRQARVIREGLFSSESPIQS